MMIIMLQVVSSHPPRRSQWSVVSSQLKAPRASLCTVFGVVFLNNSAGGCLKKSQEQKQHSIVWKRRRSWSSPRRNGTVVFAAVTTVPCPPAGGRWNVVTPSYFETASHKYIFSDYAEHEVQSRKALRQMPHSACIMPQALCVVLCALRVVLCALCYISFG